MAKFKSVFTAFSFALLMVGAMQLLASCAYTLRGTQRPFFEDYNIHSLYIQPIRNDSYRSGVDIMLYNVIRKRFVQGGYVRIVDTPNLADATLVASVTQANLAPQATVRASQLAPLNTGPSDVQVASNYAATLGVSFSLKNAHGVGLWSSGFTRTKTVQAATYFGNLGTTSALINDSEFDRALYDLAVSISTDAEESMNARF